MKVIGICGSTRKEGNTVLIMRKGFQELNKRGIETELIELYNKDIDYCKGCSGYVHGRTGHKVS